jgi:hypothetical protein
VKERPVFDIAAEGVRDVLRQLDVAALLMVL